MRFIEPPSPTPARSVNGTETDGLREFADRLPLALANQSIREPWLGIGNATGALLATAAIAVVATALAARRSAL